CPPGCSSFNLGSRSPRDDYVVHRAQPRRRRRPSSRSVEMGSPRSASSSDRYYTATHEEEIDEGHSAVLLERSADGLYTVSVGNLLAGEEATGRCATGQLPSFVQGQVRIAISTAIAPRYRHEGALSHGTVLQSGRAFEAVSQAPHPPS